MAVLTLGGIAPPASAGTVTELNLTAVRSLISLLQAPVPGFTFMAGGDLFDKTATQRLGRGDTVCGVADVGFEPVDGVTRPYARAICNSVYTLAGGELHLSSRRTYYFELVPFTVWFKEAGLVVTGGTDKYSGARGSGNGKKIRTQTGTRYTINLRVITD